MTKNTIDAEPKPEQTKKDALKTHGSGLINTVPANDVAIGKVAEIEQAGNHALPYKFKVSGDTRDSGCAVDTPNTPYTALLNTPKVQKLINQSQIQTKKNKTNRENEAARRALPTTKWKFASQDEKFRYAGHAAEQSQGQAFTLNLSDTMQHKLKLNTDPLRAFTDILNREFKKQGLSRMPYALSLEDSAKDKLHVHGFLITPSNDPQALENALRGAGGLITGRAGSTQLNIKPVSDGAGWTFYCRKDQKRTSKALKGDARLFLNRSMTQVAREFSVQS